MYTKVKKMFKSNETRQWLTWKFGVLNEFPSTDGSQHRLPVDIVIANAVLQLGEEMKPLGMVIILQRDSKTE